MPLILASGILLNFSWHHLTHIIEYSWYKLIRPGLSHTIKMAMRAQRLKAKYFTHLSLLHDIQRPYTVTS